MKMNARLKKTLKKILGKPDLKFVPPEYGAAKGALRVFIDEHEKFLIDQHHLPPREDLKPYNEAIAKMEPDYNFFSSDIFERNPDTKAIFEYDNFHSGTPMRYKPFPGAKREVRRTLRRKNCRLFKG